VKLEVDSGIPEKAFWDDFFGMEAWNFATKDMIGKTSISNNHALYVVHATEIVKGSTPTVFTVDLMESLFQNQKGNKLRGFVIRTISFANGSTTNNVTYDSATGFSQVVFLAMNTQFVFTRHNSKVPTSQILTDLAGTVSYFGAFAVAVVLIERILKVKWPCARNVHRKLTVLLEDQEAEVPPYVTHQTNLFTPVLRDRAASQPLELHLRTTRVRV
jgi:hypothetical protein